jgi:hypothetical protein
MWVFRPVVGASSIVIGALPGAAIGLALSRVSNRAYFATGLGMAFGSALYVTHESSPDLLRDRVLTLNAVMAQGCPSPLDGLCVELPRDRFEAEASALARISSRSQ